VHYHWRLAPICVGGVGQIPLRVDYTYTARNQVASMTYSLLAAEDLNSVNSGTGGWTVSVAGASPTVWATLAGSQNWSQVGLGDFTGDGLSDIVGYDSSTSKWYVVQSTGTSFTINLWLTWTAPSNPVFKVGDFNGDRLTDFLVFDPATSKWRVVLSMEP
jgi:hypothetical protein